MLPKDYDPAKKYPLIVEVHGGPASAVVAHWGGGGRIQRRGLLGAGLLCADAQSSRQLRPGRGLHPGQPQGLRLRGSARHPGRRGYGAGKVPRRSQPRGHHRLELRRLHDHVCRHPDAAIQGRGGRRRHLRLAELLRRKLHRPVDDSLLRRFGLRRSRRSMPKARPSPSSSRRTPPRWWWLAIATASVPRRSPSSSGMRCATSTSPRNWWSIPTRATALSIPPTAATCMERAVDWFARYMPPSLLAIRSQSSLMRRSDRGRTIGAGNRTGRFKPEGGPS